MTAAVPLASRFHSARTDHSLAVLEGFHALKHAIRFSAEIEIVAARDVGGLLKLAAGLAPDIIDRLERLATEVDPAAYRTLSPTPHDSGVIAIARRPRVALEGLEDATAPAVLLESPAHSGNIGAVVRVAAAAGASAVITTGSNDPWNPGAIRGAAGLHFALPVLHDDVGVPRGRTLIAVDPDGDAFDTITIPDRALLAFGSERSGLSAELLAGAVCRVRIPMRPGVSSLNLATAVAVMLYRWRLQQ